LIANFNLKFFEEMKRLMLFALMGSICYLANGQKVALKYNLAEGSSYQMKQVTEQMIKQDFQGMNMEIKMTITANTRYVVNKVSEGQYEIDIIYDQLAMKMESPMMNMNYDSQAVPDVTNPMNAAFSSLIGQKFNMVMDSKGKVLSVKGFENVMDSLTAKMGGNRDAAEQMAASLKDQFGNESMQSSMEMVMAIFPEKPVSVGETWVVNTVSNKGMQMTNENTLTLKDASNGKWVLSGNSKLTTNANLPVENQGMKMTFDLAGASTYEMTLSATTGWIQNSAIDQTISGDLSIEGGQLPAPMDVPMKISQKTTISGI
jgi:hypothetical protein